MQKKLFAIKHKKTELDDKYFTHEQTNWNLEKMETIRFNDVLQFMFKKRKHNKQPKLIG